MFKKGDWVELVDVEGFKNSHNQNKELIEAMKGFPIQLTNFTINGDVDQLKTYDGNTSLIGIYERELIRYFKLIKSHSEFGSFKLIITYIENGKTIEEEGVNYIQLSNEQVSYTFNRKKLGFITYKGEITLKIDDLKQITISTPQYERVFHIENGKVIREHIMYDNERTFNSFSLQGNNGKMN
ncbi:hypothetical protein [Yersinia phage fHe-Yen9-04]|uniref:Uncharacterized protein n=1 Tax=Yersinia phage fHe-Yen9-04 TaxID=2052742 RepID=A0A2C9D0D7_9CAUD|nr:hypothetical protein FDJ41_gp408 [Yersinia phage fHe-Yen9-04]SOK58772.1 hypothetical protein [Yersinia phage fHe-Yen9-04]VUE36541.1 hypothetical protein [Yersinia phage fHe-Yen9-04]